MYRCLSRVFEAVSLQVTIVMNQTGGPRLPSQPQSVTNLDWYRRKTEETRACVWSMGDGNGQGSKPRGQTISK